MVATCQRRAWCAASALALLATACDSPVSPGQAGLRAGQNPLAVLGREGSAVRLPFKARFHTDLVSNVPDPACGDFPRLLNTQEGWGEATHLGRFTVRITFCIDATDILDDGQLTAGESLPYDGGAGALVAANGDSLFITIAGAVVPTDDPVFEFAFTDPFQFGGGTGRFAGASGHGTTDSLVDFDGVPSRTQHDWSGSLILPRGN